MTDLVPRHHGNCVTEWQQLVAEALDLGMPLPGWTAEAARDHGLHHAMIAGLRQWIHEELLLRAREAALGITW